ncbi:oligosaccharide flippase family protein [Flavobacterium sp.]|jgi:O-antigen/teichoic acid export membrane protein|uniref:oligosaccharide flippase family protein n=1 Tax=Flavobacterium sp. TaxID=239 RepID=UPI0037C19101
MSLKKFPKKSFVRNFSVLLSTNLLVSLIGMITSIYIARVLSPVHYGEYSVVLSVIGIFQVLASLGLSTTVTREVARNQDNSKQLFKVSIWAYWGGFFIASFFLLIYMLLEKESNSEVLIGLMILSLFSQSLWTLYENIAFGMQRMEYSGFINLIMTSLLFVTYILIPTKNISVELVLLVSVIAQFFKDGLYYFYCKKNKLFTGEVNESKSLRIDVFKLIKDSLPFLIMGGFSMMSNQLPVLFLNANSGPEQVAYFNTANKLLLPITLFITTAMTALFPNLSKLYYENKESYKDKIKTALFAIAVLGVFGAVTVSFFRSEIVSLLYGNAYQSTGLVMAYQCWFIIAFAFFCFFGSIFSSADKQKLLSYLSIAYAIVSVPILWIGSKYGAEYLSLAFIITAVINMSYHWYFMQKILPTPLTSTFTLKLFGLIILPFGFSFLIPQNLGLGSKFFIYFGIIGLIGFLVKNYFISLIKEKFLKSNAF